jgi:hypothetical protein
MRDAVKTVLEPQTMPVHGRHLVPVVSDVYGDLGPLVHIEDRPGDRVVVREHPNQRVVDALAYGAYVKIETVTVV